MNMMQAYFRLYESMILFYKKWEHEPFHLHSTIVLALTLASFFVFVTALNIMSLVRLQVPSFLALDGPNLGRRMTVLLVALFVFHALIASVYVQRIRGRREEGAVEPYPKQTGPALVAIAAVACIGTTYVVMLG